jgi:hypothetical protein
MWKVKHWQDPVCLLAGLWLAVSPWMLGYDTQMTPTWNAIVAGGLIALIALYALYQVFAWEEWANVALGLWLVASPWVLGFSAMQAVTLNAVIVGALVAALALWALGTDRDIGGWLGRAH